MTGATKRWLEIVEAAAEGIAVIGADGRYAFANGRYAELAGLDLNDLLAGASAFDFHADFEVPEHVIEALGSGEPGRFELQRTDVNGTVRWYAVTVVPLAAMRLAVLALDVTDRHRSEADRRRAQHRFMETEDETRRDLCQRLHDGPIQLLNALRIRLEVYVEHEDQGQQLLELVTWATHQLRTILNNLDRPAAAWGPGALLSSWVTPLAEGSLFPVHVDDRTERSIPREVTEALFVAFYDIYDVVRTIGAPRKLDIVLDEVDDGVEMRIHVPAPTTGYEAVKAQRSQTARSLVEQFGGRLTVDRNPSYHVVRAWLPISESAPVPPRSARPAREPATRFWDRAAGYDRADRELSDADWERIAAAAHEGMIELDADFRVTYVNEAFARSIDRSTDELLGADLRSWVRPENQRAIGPQEQAMIGGQPIRFEWRRTTRRGPPAWMQVAARPRLADGQFDGALIVTLDTTDLHTADLAREMAIDDVARVRAQTQRTLLNRLEVEWRRQLTDIADVLGELMDSRPDDVALVAIRDELQESVDQVQNFAVRLERPDFSIGKRSASLRDALAPLLALADTELDFIDLADATPSGAPATALFQIACEAVANAVTHGRARNVQLTLRHKPTGFEIEISDDGAGASPDELVPTPGHLGIRSMHDHAASLGGTLQITPGAAGGVRVVARVPDVSV